MDPQRAFALLQPASVHVAKEGSVESVRGLREGVERVAAAEDNGGIGSNNLVSCINDLKEYLLFPLVVILKSRQKCSWSLQEEIVGLMLVVLGRSSVEDFTLFQEMFTQLFLILTDRTDPQKVASISEECKQTSLATVSVLVNNSSDSVRQKLCGNAFRPQFGHAVYVTLKFAQEEKNRGLKIQAMETLLSLGQQKVLDTLTAEQHGNLSSTFANFLPGIVLALTKVATADEKQGSKVTATAVDAWSYFVTLVMRDSFLAEHASGLGESETVTNLRRQLYGDSLGRDKARKMPRKDSNKFALPEPDDEVSVPKMPSVKITADWARKTGEKLVLLVRSLSKLVSHPHWRVRLSLVQWARHLVCHCGRSLAEGVVMAIEVIVALRSDDLIDVGSEAQEALIAMTQALEQRNQENSAKQSLVELLEERVFALVTQLPTICRQEDDSKTLTSIRQLVGCLEVMGERTTQLMLYPSHSHRLLQALSFALTLDTTDSDLLLEKTNSHDPFEVLSVKPSLGRSFKYYQDVRISEALSSACHLIGYHSNLVVLVDLCLELLQQSTHHQKETILLLTLIIQGRDQRKWKEKDRSSVPHEENEQVVHSILDVIMCQEIFNAPLYVFSQTDANTNSTEDLVKSLVPVNKQKNISTDLVKNNVVLVANALSLISACARMMGTEFEMFLSSVLCSVMEKAGEANVLVGHTACNALKEIAGSCEHRSVSELIERSVPQFWYSLSMRLKRLPEYPSAPLVLQVSLDYANIDVMAFTEELVEDVLTCLDTYHSERALPLLRVLLVYVTAVIRYESKISTSTEDVNSGKSEDECVCSNDNGETNRSRETSDAVDSSIAKKKISREKEIGSFKDEDNKDKVIRQESDADSDTLTSDLGPVALYLWNYHKDQMKIKQGLAEKDSEQQMESEEGSGAQNFQKYLDQKKAAEEMGEDGHEADEGMGENTDDVEEKKKDIPRYIELVVNILERCSHLLYLQDRKTKLLVMEVVKAGCEALACWEDQRLPVLHKLWQPLVLRLKDSDFVVMMRALEVLCTMVGTSGEFLRRRTLTQVFPPLLSFLRSQSQTSQGKTRRSGYYMTAAYRAQNVLLRKLPSLVGPLLLGVKEVAELVTMLLLYADTRQPPELCGAATVLLRQVAKKWPHHVWLALAHQQASVRIVPPSSSLTPVKIIGAGCKELPPEVIELYKQLS